MSPPKKMRKPNGPVKKPAPDGIIRFEVDKVSTLGCEGQESSVIAQGVSWRADVCKHNGRFSIFLFCDVQQKAKWKIDLDMAFILVHSDISKNITVEESDTVNNFTNCIYGYQLPWNEFINDENGFINDGKITVEIRLWIFNMKGIKTAPRFDFTDAEEPLHDITLLIGGEKIYASKQILGAHSPVFHAMFYGNFSEKGQKEIVLDDVDREEFIEMLYVIYPSCKQITEESAEYLLSLGDRFQIANLIDRAEEFLVASDEVSTPEKLRIADQYRLFALQEQAMSELKTKNDVWFVKDSPVYRGLSDATKAALFERMFIIAK